MSTAAYDNASRRATPRHTLARDDAWLDSWEAGQDPSHPDSQGNVPGYFAPRIYRGRSVDELIPTIVAELGEDAVVIRHHRGLTGGFVGFFQKSFVEIEARRGDPGGSLLDRYDEDGAAPALPGDAASALPGGAIPVPPGNGAAIPPNNAAPAPPRDASLLPPGNGAAIPPNNVAPAPPRDAARELPGEFDYARAPVAPPKPPNWDGATEVWATNPFAAALAEAEAAVRAAEPAVPPDLDAALAEALAEAEDAEAPEEILAAPPSDLYEQPAAAPPPVAAVVALTAESAGPLDHHAMSPAPEPSARGEIEHTEPSTLAEIEHTVPSALMEIEHTLRGVGIGEELVQELIEAASAHVLPLMPPSTSLAQAVRIALAQRIPAAAPLPAAGATIAVIGAGGSGKSACCAALIEAYREHSTLPATCVAILPGAMPEEPALHEARTGGVLLLDTPPVSCADPDSISALAGLLERLRPDRVVLALPATLGATPAAQLLEALGPLGADALAITHADETDQLGVATQTACTFGLAPIHLLARAEHGGVGAGVAANAPDAPRAAWALTWTDPFLLTDRLLPPR